MDIIRCSKCGTEINEPVNLPIEDRQPCPRCGSTMRDKRIVISDSLTIGYSIAPTVSTPAEAPPAGSPPIGTPPTGAPSGGPPATGAPSTPAMVTIKDEDQWDGIRIGLLGMWITIYISVYVPIVTVDDSGSAVMNLFWASFAGLLGLGIIFAFKSKKIKGGFFWYFDWIAGSERKTNWRCFLIVIVFSVVLILSGIGVLLGA